MPNRVSGVARMNKSTWQKFPMARFPKITESGSKKLSYDVVVIGGGITGLTTAYFLKRAGAKVCLIERDRLASGDTGHTTGHLNSFIDLRVSDLVRAFGQGNATLVLQAGQTAIDAIEATAAREHIACEFRRVPGFLHAPLLSRDASELEVARFKKDAAAARRLGFDCTFDPSVPGAQRPGVRFANQGLFHPLKFLAGLAEVVDGKGSAIFEGTEADTVETGPLRVCGKGFQIRCGQVVVATHVPLAGKTNLLSATLFQTKIALYSSYVVGARIPKGSLPEISASDTSDPYYYWRVEPGERSDYVIFGGRDHKTGQVKNPAHRFVQLERALGKLLPEAKVDRRWSGQVIETHDGLPFIGQMSEGQFISTGYTGNGMTFGVVGALMARDSFLGQANPWSGLFSPHRVEVRAGGLREYFKENVDYPVYMLKQRLTPPKVKSPDAIANGDGAVLKIAGERVACSRDDSGKLHKVSAVCTHMGCLVQWNGAEKTWDCPCHGSRFSPVGKVVAGPAEKPLKMFAEEPAAEPAPVRRNASAKASARDRTGKGRSPS